MQQGAQFYYAKTVGISQTLKTLLTLQRCNCILSLCLQRCKYSDRDAPVMKLHKTENRHRAHSDPLKEEIMKKGYSHSSLPHRWHPRRLQDAEQAPLLPLPLLPEMTRQQHPQQRPLRQHPQLKQLTRQVMQSTAELSVSVTRTASQLPATHPWQPRMRICTI